MYPGVQLANWSINPLFQTIIQDLPLTIKNKDNLKTGPAMKEDGHKIN
jgi:hypothetical protein